MKTSSIIALTSSLLLTGCLCDHSPDEELDTKTVTGCLKSLSDNRPEFANANTDTEIKSPHPSFKAPFAGRIGSVSTLPHKEIEKEWQPECTHLIQACELIRELRKNKGMVSPTHQEALVHIQSKMDLTLDQAEKLLSVIMII